MSTARRAAGPCPPSARATSAAIRSRARAGATPRARCSWARSSRRTSVKVVAISSSAAQGARSAPRARSASWATSSRTAVKAAESASAGADRGSRRGRARESSVASPSTRPQPFPFPCSSTCAPAGFCVSIRAESARLAAGYLSLGLKPGDRLASLLPNRVALVLHYLACFKAGLVATPLNYRYTAREIDHGQRLKRGRR